MKTENESTWQQLPAATLPSPVLALAAHGHELWAGGLGGVARYSIASSEAIVAAYASPGGAGGVARYPASHEQNTWEPQVATLPLSSVTALLALDGVLLAGGSEGIAFSSSGGATWQQAKLEDGVVAVTAFAASPNFASDQTAVAATLANGIIRTTDGGRTWLNASFGLESMEVTTLIWEAEANILAASTDGIYRSRDAGRAWRRVYAGEELEIEAFVSLPDGTILAALVDKGLLHSQDGGKHWDVKDLSIPGVQVSTLCATSTGTVLLGTFEHGLLRSSDEGAARASMGGYYGGHESEIVAAHAGPGGAWRCVYEQVVYACMQIDEHIYVGTDTGVGLSLDDGLTWTELPCPPIHDLRTLLVRDDHLLLVGRYAGIVRYAPATSAWESLENIPQPLTACAFAPDSAPIRPANDATASSFAQAGRKEDALFLSSPAGLAHMPLGEGHTAGVPATTGVQVLVEGQAGQVAHIAMRQSDTGWHIWAASADGSRLLRSQHPNGVLGWQPLRAPFGVLPVVALQAIPDRVFAATYDPREYRVCVWYSTDDGETWVRSLEAGTTWPVVATCVQPPALGIGNALLLERSPGQWQQTTVGNDGGGIRRILSIQFDEKMILFVLTTTGIQRSEDMGANWQQDNARLPADQIIDIAATGTTLTVLLSGGRVWQRTISEEGERKSL